MYYTIHQIFGYDGRTVRKHLKGLVEHNFLEPRGSPRREKRDVTIRKPQTGGVKILEYWSNKGFSHYVFGFRAPRTYQETLNPKCVSPRTPLRKVVKGKVKTKCVSGRGLGVNEFDPIEDHKRALRLLDFLEKNITNKKKIEDIEEKRLCDTHV